MKNRTAWPGPSGRAWWLAVALAGGLLQVLGTAAGLAGMASAVAGLPAASELDAGLSRMARATVVYDAANRPAFSIFEQQRREIPLEAVSPHLVAAIIAIEDQRFYHHRGLDLIRIAGAGLANLRERRRAQGGSTLTQQLARQSFLTPDKTYRRKLQEAVLALRIERSLAKNRILELYVNRMYFGAGLYGAEAAALGYFGKSARDLTLPEAALLAGLLKSPSTLAPTVNPEQATARRDVVLQAMYEDGVIDRATYDSARQSPLGLSNAVRGDEATGLYFREHVRMELLERFGRQAVYEGGLRVYTTLLPEMQQAAERAVEASLRELERRRSAGGGVRRAAGDDGVLQAALVAIDPQNGHVRAMVGGRRFAESAFNRATQARRQPGSAFKPFVYAAALDAGYSPASLIDDLDRPLALPSGAWTPDDDHGDATALTLRAALTASSNRAAVHLIARLGVSAAVEYARGLGMTALPAVPSLALGAGEVSLLDLTSAYGAFAAGGWRHHPLFIRRVEDHAGRVLYEAEPHADQAVTPQTAFLMASMLADVVDRGTASRARQLGFHLPAGGKTGTTNDYRDAWFVGFTPTLVSGVWIGFDRPRRILPGGAYASDVAVPLWTTFMKAVTSGDRSRWLTPPPGIVTAEVCRLSGQRPSAGCDAVRVVRRDGSGEERSMVMREFFVRGSEPVDTCPLHAGRSLIARLGDWLSVAEPVAAERPADAAPPAAAAEAAAQASATATDTPNAGAAAPKKRRGFWSRLFRRGDRDDSPRPVEPAPAGRPAAEPPATRRPAPSGAG